VEIGKDDAMSAARGMQATAAMAMAVLLLAAPAHAGGWRPGKKKGPTGPVAESLQTYLQKVNAMGATVVEPTRGSLWTPEASWGDLATDYKARQTGDLVTILLADQFSASTASTVQSQRAFASQSAITQLFGIVGPRSGIANLFSPSAQTTLNSKGQSATTRSLQTTLSGQVVAVLPNGVLVIQAARDINFGNERQTVVVRGLARPGDISPGNMVSSTALSNLEVEVKGKGVVSDGTRGPNPIVRLILRLLTF
jgi:flagellar L-ring protein precursor FlgH